MQLGHLAVVAVEEGDKVFRQIALIFFVQRADDAAVDTDVLRIFRMLVADEDVAGMHIGVEETVAEHLSEEHLHTALGQQLHIDAVLLQRGNIGDRNAVNALHHQHGLAAVVGEHFRYVQHTALVEIAAQLNRIGGFTQQIEFINQRFLVVAHHFHRTQTATVRQQTWHPARRR